MIFRQIWCNIVEKTPVLLLLVYQVSSIDGQHAPPMLAKIGGVPSP